MIKPFGKQILVQPVIKSQIAVSDNVSLCEYGKVIDIGDDVQKIKVGDEIGFTVWGLNHIEINGIKYYFVLEDTNFILGTIHE